jgi:hypothetical protein
MSSWIDWNEEIQTVAWGRRTLRQLVDDFGIGHIVRRFGQWVVTDRGLECLVTEYCIEAKALDQKDWAFHMGEKRWVDKEEFEAAYAFARQYHGREVALPASTRG